MQEETKMVLRTIYAQLVGLGDRQLSASLLASVLQQQYSEAFILMQPLSTCTCSSSVLCPEHSSAVSTR